MCCNSCAISADLNIMDFSVDCCENRCADNKTSSELTASKCRWYVNSLNKIWNNFYWQMISIRRCCGTVYCTYLTGTMTSRLTTALKNDSNFDPSTAHVNFDCIVDLSTISIQVAPVVSSVPDDRAKSAGIASKCCSNWYSEPVSIKYFTVHRMINNALNVCQIWRLLQLYTTTHTNWWYDDVITIVKVYLPIFIR